MTPEEAWRAQWPKHHNSNRDEDIKTAKLF